MILMHFCFCFFGKSWSSLAKWPCSPPRALHQSFGERKKLNQISKDYTWPHERCQPCPENFNEMENCWISINSDFWTNFSLFIPFWRLREGNPDLMTKICRLNHGVWWVEIHPSLLSERLSCSLRALVVCKSWCNLSSERINDNLKNSTLKRGFKQGRDK